MLQCISSSRITTASNPYQLREEQAIVSSFKALSGMSWSDTDGLNIGVSELDTWKVYSTVSIHICGNFHFTILIYCLGPPKIEAILEQGISTL
jgi:hypothetical protein